MSKLQATVCDICGFRQYDEGQQKIDFHGPIDIRIVSKESYINRIHEFQHACSPCAILMLQHLNSCTKRDSLEKDKKLDKEVEKREAFFKELDEILGTGTSHTAEQVYAIEAARKKMLEPVTITNGDR